MTVDKKVHDLAEVWLSDEAPDTNTKAHWKAHEARVQRYAEAVQQALQDCATDEEAEAEAESRHDYEMQQLRGYSDAERDRI